MFVLRLQSDLHYSLVLVVFRKCFLGFKGGVPSIFFWELQFWDRSCPTRPIHVPTFWWMAIPGAHIRAGRGSPVGRRGPKTSPKCWYMYRLCWATSISKLMFPKKYAWYPPLNKNTRTLGAGQEWRTPDGMTPTLTSYPLQNPNTYLPKVWGKKKVRNWEVWL